MTTTASRIEQTALEFSERAAELLGADVSVVDEHGRVIAACGGVVAGEPYHGSASNVSKDDVRIPLRLDSRTGEAIVVKRNGEDVCTAQLAEVLLDMLLTQITVAHEMPCPPEVKDRFIHKLLQGSVDDEGLLLREAQILGMDLSQPRAVILIDADHYVRAANDHASIPAANARQRAGHVISSTVGFFTLPNDTICGYIGDGELVVLKASSTRNLAPWTAGTETEEEPVDSWANLSALKHACDALLARLRHDTRETISIGVGRYHPGVSGMSRSYQDARAALSLGRHVHGENRVHCLNNLGLAAFVGVADVLTKYDLANYLLGPLDHEPYLIRTLETFFAEDCCPSSTASQLSIHRNTLSYRLQKVTSLIGLNPNHFEDAVQIRLALALRSLQYNEV